MAPFFVRLSVVVLAFAALSASTVGSKAASHKTVTPVVVARGHDTRRALPA